MVEMSTSGSGEGLGGQPPGLLNTISMVDHAIGRILDFLETAGQLDNTLLVFSSDHGEMLQDHGHYQKMLPFESSAHIPFVVRYPRAFAPGSRSEALVDLLDIMPTALDVAGASPAHPWTPAWASLLRLGRDRDRERRSALEHAT